MHWQLTIDTNTGPTFTLYNASLRGFPAKDVACLMGNKYETTIFTITSGVMKLSKVTSIPLDRRLYRGLGGMILPKQFWLEFEECQVTVMMIVDSGSMVVAESIVQKIMNQHTTKIPAAAGCKDAAFELGCNYLLLVKLQISQTPSSLGTALADNKIRVIQPPKIKVTAGVCCVRMSLALPISKFNFTDSMSSELQMALKDMCGGSGISIKIEEVINKPHDFKGGGELYS
jgi:hypothetical protein